MYPVSPGVYMDIDRLRKLIRRRKPNARVNVARMAMYVRRGYAGVKRHHVYRGKLKTEPVIVMRVAGIDVLIDGWHRTMRHHWKRTRKWLSAIRISDRDARKCSWAGYEITHNKKGIRR
jgi:hypothetical protein